MKDLSSSSGRIYDESSAHSVSTATDYCGQLIWFQLNLMDIKIDTKVLERNHDASNKAPRKKGPTYVVTCLCSLHAIRRYSHTYLPASQRKP